jgi:hypothetical protein
MDCATIGRIRLSATAQPGLLTVDHGRATQVCSPSRPPNERRNRPKLLFSVFRQHDPGFATLTKQLDAVYTNWPASTTLALRQRTEPRDARIFKRGDWQKQAEEVGADVPAVLHAFPAGAPRNRLGFAEWLIARRSPTTARVLVNRIWQAYFWQGLFTTAEDIGTRVEPPSHPRVVDWLACEFMERGWSFKEMHRLITSSATYRRPPGSRLRCWKRSYNRLLARGPVSRRSRDCAGHRARCQRVAQPEDRRAERLPAHPVQRRRSGLWRI